MSRDTLAVYAFSYVGQVATRDERGKASFYDERTRRNKTRLNSISFIKTKSKVPSPVRPECFYPES